MPDEPAAVPDDDDETLPADPEDPAADGVLADDPTEIPADAGDPGQPEPAEEHDDG